MKKVALICGISGQDGAYLASFLISKNYEVWGTSRDAPGSKFINLEKLGIKSKVHFLSMAPEDFRSVLVSLKLTTPDEVYFLAGQSSVGLSFELPSETIQGIIIGTLNLLEACRMLDKQPRLYFAGSSECFGDTMREPANEMTAFHPQSPYAVAKSSAYWLVNNYRKAYGIFACTGILFNHESPLRPARFVTQKIVIGASRIASGEKKSLLLGNLQIYRDWGWAPEYVEAMWLMLQLNEAKDLVIATGKTYSLEHFVSLTFSYYNLDWRKYVEFDNTLLRPSDILYGSANPNLAYELLGWRASVSIEEIISKMCASADNNFI